MNSNFEFIQLKDCIETIIDHRGKTPKKLGGDWQQEGVKAISAKNVNNGKLVNLNSIRYVSEDIYQKWMNEDVKPGDVLLVSEGATLGHSMYWDSKEKIVLSQRLFCIRANSEVMYPKYLAAYVTSRAYQGELFGRATGTSVLGLRQSELLETSILHFSMKEQKVIGDIYYNLNKKIETNNEINKKLEEMAQAIFKQWFVDFEFPNENGEPYKSSGGAMVESELGMIPEGWEVSQLSTILKIKHGFAFKSENFTDDKTELLILTPGNFKVGGGFKSDKFKYLMTDTAFPNEYILNDKDLIVSMTDLSRDGDTLGYPAFIPKSKTEKYLHNQRLGRVILKQEFSKRYLYLLMCTRIYRGHILGTSTGTTVKHTAPKRIEEFKFVKPPLFLLNRFDEIISPLFESIKNRDCEDLNLISLRDNLLPKLMSGEIRVPVEEQG